MKENAYYAAAMAGLALLMLLALFLGRHNHPAPHPLLGQDPIADVALLEDHSEVLPRWSEKGVRDAVLLLVDAHDDSRPPPSEKIEKLRGLHRRGDWQALRRADSLADHGLYNPGNFVHAAFRLGIVREVYWVVPFPLPETGDTAGLKRLLKRHGFTDADIATFGMRSGCFSGLTGGIPLSVCGIGDLPAIPQPLILSIDIDFLPPLAARCGNDPVEAVSLLFSALREKSYRVADVSVACSVNGGYTDPRHRWIADLVVELTKQPSLLSAANLPARWESYRRADRNALLLPPGESLRRLHPVLSGASADPALLLYGADACYLLNRVDMAFGLAERACLQDRRYCYGMPHYGRLLTHEQRLPEAERFVERGHLLHPGMLYAQWELAFAFKRAGRYKDAVRHFDRLKPLVGSFPLELFIGEIHLLLGERGEAMRHCRAAAEGGEEGALFAGDDIQLREAVHEAVARFEREKVGDCAQRMRERTGLQSL